MANSVLSTNGLVGWWKLDEESTSTFLDSGALAVTGTLQNSPPWSIPAPAITFGEGQAHSMSFNGTNQRANSVGAVSNYSFIQNSGVFSISCWVKLSSTSLLGQTSQISILGNTPTTSEKGFYLMFGDGTANNRLSFAMTKASAGTPVILYNSSNNAINDANWHHVVVTGNGSTATFYVDNVALTASSAFGSFSSSDSTRTLTIGACNSSTGDNYFWNGLIDDLRVYNGTLTTDQIATLYAGQTGLTDSSLKSWWKMDGYGGVAFDSSGLANNGTYLNSPTVNSSAPTIGHYNPYSMTFNGSNTVVYMGDVLDSYFTGSNKQFTISAWVKPAASNTNSVIVGKVAGGALNERQFFFRLYTGSKPEFLWYGDLTGNTYRGTLGSTAITSTSTWYHLVATYDGTNGTINNRVALYVNAVAESTSIDLTAGTPSTIPDGPAKLSIGDGLSSTNVTQSIPFNGSIDDVRIYSRILTATEIADIYNGSYV